MNLKFGFKFGNFLKLTTIYLKVTQTKVSKKQGGFKVSFCRNFMPKSALKTWEKLPNIDVIIFWEFTKMFVALHTFYVQ